MIFILQILVSVLFFSHKVYVLLDKKSGWLIGASGATLAVAYFFLIDLYVYTVLEIGLIILMVYGFFKKDQTSQRTQMIIRSTTVIFMLTMTFFAWSGMITMIELVSSAGLLVGTYFLTHHMRRLGWGLYAIAHALAAYLGYAKEQHFFADLQIASAIVSCIGITITETKKLPVG